jgi:hypothetical protein
VDASSRLAARIYCRLTQPKIPATARGSSGSASAIPAINTLSLHRDAVKRTTAPLGIDMPIARKQATIVRNKRAPAREVLDTEYLIESQQITRRR